MDVLGRHGGHEIDRHEVPDPADARGDHPVRDVLRDGTPCGDHTDRCAVLTNVSIHIRKIKHRLAVDELAYERGIHIEKSHDIEAHILEAGEIRERAADVASARDDYFMFAVKRKDRADLGKKGRGVVSVTLLSEPAETVEILPDLRGVEIHLLRQLFA